MLPRTLGVGRSWPAGTALTARCVIVLQIGQAFQNKTQLAMTKLEVKKTGHKAVKGCVSAPPLSPPNAVLGALAGPFAHSRSDYSPALSWAVQFVGCTHVLKFSASARTDGCDLHSCCGLPRHCCNRQLLLPQSSAPLRGQGADCFVLLFSWQSPMKGWNLSFC